MTKAFQGGSDAQSMFLDLFIQVGTIAMYVGPAMALVAYFFVLRES